MSTIPQEVHDTKRSTVSLAAVSQQETLSKRMKAVLGAMRAGKRPQMSPRDLQFFRHAVEAELSAPQLARLMADEHKARPSHLAPQALH